jgi:hypothetical protein
MPECVAYFGLASCLPPSIENMVNGSSFGSGLIRKVGQFTGVTDAVNCAKNPSWGTCAKAAVKLTLTAVTIATLGAGATVEAPAEVGLDAATDATTDAATSATTNVTTDVTGDAATGSGTQVATRASGTAAKWTVRRIATSCMTGLALACTISINGVETVVHDRTVTQVFADQAQHAEADKEEEYEFSEAPYMGGFGPGDPYFPPNLPTIAYWPFGPPEQ